MVRGKKRDISEEQLAEMQSFYLDSHTLTQTAERFGVGYGYLHSAFKSRGWIRRPGTRVAPSVVGSFNDDTLIEQKREWDALDSTVKGSVAEGFAKVKLASLGFDVWEAVSQNHRTDLVILFGRQVVKLQVKSASYDLPSKSFRANLSRHRRAGGHPVYEDGDVDFFLVYCAGLPSIEFYVIPAERAKGNVSPRFFPHRPMAFQLKSFTWEVYRNAFDLLSEAASV